MQGNVGGIDRLIRIIAGVLIITAGAYYHNWWGLIGVVLLLTGLIRWCPAYLPFGLSTRKHPPQAN